MKRVVPIAILLFAVALSCCNDGEETPPVVPPPPVKSADLTEAYGVVNPTDSKRVQLVISNFESDFIEEFTGAGEFLSLELEASGITVMDGVLTLPSGKYGFETGTQMICKSEVSYYASQDDSGKKTLLPLTGGTLTVSESAGEYTVSGEVSDDNRQVIEFSFTGALLLDPGTGRKTMTEVEVTYNNKFSLEKKFAYQLLLRNDDGQQVCLDISTALSDYFTNIPAGIYPFSDTATDAGTLLKSNDSYYTLMVGGAQHPIGAGTVTLTKTADSYTIVGTVSAPGRRGLEFTFTGALPVTKAALYFKNGDCNIWGQSYVMNTFEYEFFTYPDEADRVRERLVLYLAGPIRRYYDYLPLVTGTYSVYGGDVPFAPFQVCTCYDYTNTGLTFYDAEENEIFYLLTDGELKLTASTMVGTKYNFAMEGQFTCENEDGEQLAIDLIWDGTLDTKTNPYDYDGSYWLLYTTHPYTTLTGDVTKNNFTQAYYNDCGPGWWYENGGPTDRTYVELFLLTENARYREWVSSRGQKSNYFFQIGLNLAGEQLPESGIPTGTYTLDMDAKFAPNTFMPGNIINGFTNSPQGTNFFDGGLSGDYGEIAPWGCGPNENGGQITISKAGDIYTITATGFDDLGRDAHKLSATYTGKILDVSEAPRLAPGQNSAPSKFVKKHPREQVRRTNFVER